MLARIQAWFVLPMLYFLFLALEGLGTGRLKSRLCSLLSKQEGKGWLQKVEMGTQAHQESGSSFTVCNPQQTLSGLSIVPTAQCAAIPLPPVTLSLSSI